MPSFADMPAMVAALGGSFSRSSGAMYKDNTGTWQTVGNDVMRASHYDESGAKVGLLIEEARTNGMRNSTMQGAVVGVLGSGGSLPTYWTMGTTGSATIEVIAIGVINGLDYIDIKMSGPGDGASMTLYMENTNIFACTQGDFVNHSMWAQLIAGSWTGISFGMSLSENNGGTLLTSASNYLTPDGTLRRYEVQRTIANGSTTSARPRPRFDGTNGVPFNFTIRIAAPQIEKGSEPSTPIRTTGAQATRAADILSVPTAVWNIPEGGTFVTEGFVAKALATGSDRRYWEIGDDTGSNRIYLYASNSSDRITSRTFVNGIGFSAFGEAITSAAQNNKLAYRSQINNNGLSVNGRAVVTQTAINQAPKQSTLRLGCDRLNSNQLQGYLKSFKAYAYNFSDAELVAASS